MRDEKTIICLAALFLLLAFPQPGNTMMQQGGGLNPPTITASGCDGNNGSDGTTESPNGGNGTSGEFVWLTALGNTHATGNGRSCGKGWDGTPQRSRRNAMS